MINPDVGGATWRGYWRAEDDERRGGVDDAQPPTWVLRVHCFIWWLGWMLRYLL